MAKLIESYDFGLIVINGKQYRSDVIVFPERVIEGWWRKEGHRIHLEDLREVLNCKPIPEVLVIGTGYSGLVRVNPEVESALKSMGIKLLKQPTKEACKTFNELLKAGRRVAGAFHITC
ncbi:MAG: Mth938-like domain-containing protein [Candidatus Bathyarchaeia archaeon]